MLEVDKEALVRMVAKEAGFTLGDVRIIFETIENCIYNIVKDGGKLRWHRILKLHVKDIKEYEGWNPIDKKPMTVPAHKRIYMAPSKIMHDFVNGVQEEKIDE